MKQFNLLVVSKDGSVYDQVTKSASRVFRRNFVLQVESVDEAFSLLNRLNINLLLLDLDVEDAQIRTFNATYPNLMVIGFARNARQKRLGVDPARNLIFPKEELRTALAAELKAIRKDKGESAVKAPSFTPLKAESTDFKDFSRLVAAN